VEQTHIINDTKRGKKKENSEDRRQKLYAVASTQTKIVTGNRASGVQFLLFFISYTSLMARIVVYTLTRHFASLLAFIIFRFLNKDENYTAISAWANAFNSRSNHREKVCALTHDSADK
jgi:hypothetical protein